MFVTHGHFVLSWAIPYIVVSFRVLYDVIYTYVSEFDKTTHFAYYVNNSYVCVKGCTGDNLCKLCSISYYRVYPTFWLSQLVTAYKGLL